MKVFVPGGAGYKGAVLVPKLLRMGHEVVVYDLFIYDRDVFADLRDNKRFTEIRGDVRKTGDVREAARGCDAAIHLACISNDPTCDLDPELSRSINLNSFPLQCAAMVDAGIRRLVFASSASVYGVSKDAEVTESAIRMPVSGYNRYKAECEDFLSRFACPRFEVIAIRPATVCGCSPRLRLDLAFFNKRITVFGGDQYRPHVHIEDITDLYCQMLLREPRDYHEVFNAGWHNRTIAGTAQDVKSVFAIYGDDIEVSTTDSSDPRSYRVNSDKLTHETGFEPKRTVLDAASELRRAFADNEYPGAMTSTRFVNIKRMQEIGLK